MLDFFFAHGPSARVIVVNQHAMHATAQFSSWSTEGVGGETKWTNCEM